MDSGPTVGGTSGAGGGDGDSREKQRWVGHKVYTRRSFKGSKKNIDTNTNGTSNKNNGDNKEKDNGIPNNSSNNEEKDNGNPNNSTNDNDSNNNNSSSNVAGPPPLTLVSEDTDLPQKQLAAPLDAVSEDLGLNRAQIQVHNPSVGNDSMNPGLQDSENGVEVSLSSRSKQERRELKRKLENELDMVRSVMKRLEAEEVQNSTGFSNTPVPPVASRGVINGGLKRVHSDVASVGPTVPSRPFHQISIPVVEHSQAASDVVEKEKRTPKANQFYTNSEFLLAKDKFPPAESNKKSKSNGKKHGGGEMGFAFGAGKYFKSCSSLLERLMKHKHGWVFNAPVDVASMRLHDYYSIIKHPMDLGTVKSRLNTKWYKSPREFAEDVRLTFRNAMTYNPKGQDVHTMAEGLLKVFEDRWAIIEADYIRELRLAVDYEAGLTTPTSRKTIPSFPLLSPFETRRILDRSESMTHFFDPKSKPGGSSGRTPAPKKPKAKDLHKRDMTYEEKQKLSTNLQNLPSEKLDQIVQIIKKRNSTLSQHDDEIEVDIDSVDAETLWELDRFVTNYRKSLSKNKRKAELAIQARTEAAQNVQEKNPGPVLGEAPQQVKAGDQNGLNSLPIQGQKQPGDNVSGSSSSSSSSSDSDSSSSDSDSESSSGSGSDGPHSPAT